MRHYPGGALERAQTRRCWRAAAGSLRSDRPRWSILMKRTKSSRSPRARGVRSAPHSVRCAHVSQAGVRTVAERPAAGRLATAEPDFLGRRGGARDRGQSGALVRAGAERLVGAPPASAPEIPLAGLDGDAVGLLLSGYRFGHYLFPAVALASVCALQRRARRDCMRAAPDAQARSR